MKSRLFRLSLVPAAALMVAGLVAVLAPSSDTNATIVGSSHDLRTITANASDEVCIFCHTPHNAQATEPLWNHGITAATFTTYSSTTLNATVGQPDGSSKLCLSCHDGTVALDTFGGNTGTHFISGTAALGTDISNDHPVSFLYDAALVTADGGGLVSPASASLVVTGVPLYAGKMQCASCHQVHDNTNGNFLRFANTASALCLKCHVK